MGKEQRRILDMLSSGKITVDEAEKLLAAVSSDGADGAHKTSQETLQGTLRPKFLRVVVEPSEGSTKSEKVSIRVPLRLIRAGLKWASFIPREAQDKISESLKDRGLDMDFTKMSKEDLDELIENLNDLTVDVEGEESVRIFCE
jgi:hypothetical protein